MMHDLVIRGGMVVDGTGRAAYPADVAIQGDRIVRVGADVGPGKREIDARGKHVLPGFVDVHTHYDAQATWDPTLTPSSWHGVTTVVMGNCGVGFAPVRPDAHDWLIDLMEGVEDIPGSAMHEGIQWSWETFPEYMAAIEKKPHVMDLACLVPHGAVRAYVMGKRGADNEPATPEEIAEMRGICAEALKAGALGVSTSRTPIHKAKDGTPMPGTFAALEEVRGLAAALTDAGHGVLQLTSEHETMDTEIRWMREIARETGHTVSFNLSQIDGRPELWKKLLAEVEAARAAGEPIVAQVAGRAIGIVMGFLGTAHPFATRCVWGEIMNATPEEKLAKVLDPAFRKRLIADEPMSMGPFIDFITQSYDRMFVVEGSLDYEPSPELSVGAIARREGRPPAEVAYDQLAKDGGRGMLYFPLFNYADGDLEPVRTLHMSDATVMGLSDAGAHCGAICDGGMPTFMLTHWAMGRARGERIPLERIVRRQTHDTARMYGLDDRGVLAAGFLADVLVVDLDRLALEPPELVFDLPAQGRRLAQRARGYEAVIKRGVVCTENDAPTGALPGQLIRGPQQAPAV